MSNVKKKITRPCLQQHT